jgi:hypothetical protein
MDVFLLFAQKLRTDRIEGVATQFVFTLHELEYIQLQTTVENRLFRVALAVSF